VPVIGITGGISTGKTAFCDCPREIIPAAKFFYANQAVRQLVDLAPDVKKSSGRRVDLNRRKRFLSRRKTGCTFKRQFWPTWLHTKENRFVLDYD
jgi:dephospho-CoA kinase